MSYVDQFGDFMSGDFMSGDFLTWIRLRSIVFQSWFVYDFDCTYCIIVYLNTNSSIVQVSWMTCFMVSNLRHKIIWPVKMCLCSFNRSSKNYNARDRVHKIKKCKSKNVRAYPIKTFFDLHFFRWISRWTQKIPKLSANTINGEKMTYCGD